MKIGQVAKQYGISKDNLYYYINYGLLVPPKHNSQYVFDDATLADLEMILELKASDYSLSEIHRILSLHRVSGLENPKDRAELQGFYTRKRDECVTKIQQYEKIISELDEKIIALSEQDEGSKKHTGLPLTFLDLLCCPVCGKTLAISNVNMDMKYIYDGNLSCECGYNAKIDDGILITPNGYKGEQDKPDLERELYKDLPPSLISLFQRAYNNMKDELAGIDCSGKVVMETYINAWFFLHNHQKYFSTNGKYIIVDKFPETLRMYKDLIEREQYELPILYLADSSTDFPLKKGIVDLNLDFFACNEHNFYKDSFLLEELKPYLKDDGLVLGTYFSFVNGKRSMQRLHAEYPDSSKRNFSLKWFEEKFRESGFQMIRQRPCGGTNDSGDNLGFSFHEKGDEMELTTYFGQKH